MPNAIASSCAPHSQARPFLDATQAWRASRGFASEWAELWPSLSEKEIGSRGRLRARSFPHGFPAPARGLLAGCAPDFMRAIEEDPRLAIAPVCALSRGARASQPLFAWAWLVGMRQPAQWVSERLAQEASAEELGRALGDLPEAVAERPGYLSGVEDRSMHGPDRLFWLAVALHQRTGDDLFCRALAARPQLAAAEMDFWRLIERASWRQGPYERAVWMARLSLDPGFRALKSVPADAKKLERAARNSLFRLGRQKLPLPAELVDALAQSGAQTTPRPLFLARRLPGQRPLSPEVLASFSKSAGATPAELALGDGFPAAAASLAARGVEVSRERLAAVLPPISERSLAVFESELLRAATQTAADRAGGAGAPLEAPKPARSAPRL